MDNDATKVPDPRAEKRENGEEMIPATATVTDDMSRPSVMGERKAGTLFKPEQAMSISPGRAERNNFVTKYCEILSAEEPNKMNHEIFKMAIKFEKKMFSGTGYDATKDSYKDEARRVLEMNRNRNTEPNSFVSEVDIDSLKGKAKQSSLFSHSAENKLKMNSKDSSQSEANKLPYCVHFLRQTQANSVEGREKQSINHDSMSNILLQDMERCSAIKATPKCNGTSLLKRKRIAAPNPVPATDYISSRACFEREEKQISTVTKNENMLKMAADQIPKSRGTLKRARSQAKSQLERESHTTGPLNSEGVTCENKRIHNEKLNGMKTIPFLHFPASPIHCLQNDKNDIEKVTAPTSNKPLNGNISDISFLSHQDTSAPATPIHSLLFAEDYSMPLSSINDNSQQSCFQTPYVDTGVMSSFGLPSPTPFGITTSFDSFSGNQCVVAKDWLETPSSILGMSTNVDNELSNNSFFMFPSTPIARVPSSNQQSSQHSSNQQNFGSSAQNLLRPISPGVTNFADLKNRSRSMASNEKNSAGTHTESTLSDQNRTLKELCKFPLSPLNFHNANMEKRRNNIGTFQDSSHANHPREISLLQGNFYGDDRNKMVPDMDDTSSGFPIKFSRPSNVNYEQLKTKKPSPMIYPVQQKLSKHGEEQKEQTSVEIRCRCKRSMCLKKYCDCFAASNLCSPHCSCNDCRNSMDYIDERKVAISKAIVANPKAFETKQNRMNGCKCKKSQCLKKYCECFAANLVCKSYCKCISCANSLSTEPSSQDTITKQRTSIRNQPDCNTIISVGRKQDRIPTNVVTPPIKNKRKREESSNYSYLDGTESQLKKKNGLSIETTPMAKRFYPNISNPTFSGLSYQDSILVSSPIGPNVLDVNSNMNWMSSLLQSSIHNQFSPN